MLLVSLISEQTIPNLLPILYLTPEANLLVHTSSENSSLKPAQRLKALLPPDMETALTPVDPYQIDQIQADLLQALDGHTDVVFNLTGGTKPMALAAFQAARTLGARCIYYRTEGNRERSQQSVLYWYRFDEQGDLIFERKQPLPALLDLDTYLKAYIGDYEESEPDKSEQGYAVEVAVRKALQGHVDEIKTNVRPKGVKNQAEIDILIRRGNNVAALEIKSGGKGSGKKALDQLTTVVAREYLGTYAKRVIVTRFNPDVKSSWYKALANALRVEVIELRLRNNRMDDQDKRTLLQRIDQILPKSSSPSK